MATNWYDLIATAEEEETSKVRQMSVLEWKQAGKQIMSQWTGDLRDCLNHLERLDRLRDLSEDHAEECFMPPVLMTPTQLDFAVWRDMVEEPGKYGNDIVEWLDINDRLVYGPGRWRVAAFWTDLEDRLYQQQSETAVVKIQSLIRGHQARHRSAFRDCSRCLSHCISPIQAEEGMICYDCMTESLQDIVNTEQRCRTPLVE